MDVEASAEDIAEGKNIWHWGDMEEEENAMWEDDDSDDEDENDSNLEQFKNALAYHQLDSLDLLLDVAGGDEDLCKEKLLEIIQDPFTEVSALATVLATKVGEVSAAGPLDPDEMILLNLLYAPRRSRLHSVLRTLVRIENAGQICAWTKASNLKDIEDLTPLRGCPPIDIVDIPRLKLTFTTRRDHAGQLRMYSIDHSDLFISNERNPLTTKMLSGLPHSLLLSTLQGEMQVLMPVVRTVRPKIKGEPFTTLLVLDRNNSKWNGALSQRYYMYPVHVSLAFLQTKGLDTALYLMLCRLLARDYETVFHLSDSIATDSKFSKEGTNTFKALSLANDDWHPDAHAIRLKTSLMTVDSGVKAPWDITIQLARHCVKLERVSANCKLTDEEEFQLLNSPLVVTSEKSTSFDAKVHDHYSMALVSNRKAALAAIVQAENGSNLLGGEPITVECIVPPRQETKAWPFYMDNTVLGEKYASVADIITEEQWTEFVQGPEEPPESGWLSLVIFHVLWSPECVAVVDSMREVAPAFPAVRFAAIRADGLEMQKIAQQQFKVTEFPTMVLMRGDGQELARIEGPILAAQQALDLIRANITDEDLAANLALRKREAEGKNEELEEEDTGELQWVFDNESCGDFMQVDNCAMTAVLLEDDDESKVVRWERRPTNSYMNWNPLPEELQTELEKQYKAGQLYSSGYIYHGVPECMDVWIYPANPIKITSFSVTEMSGQCSGE